MALPDHTPARPNSMPTGRPNPSGQAAPAPSGARTPPNLGAQSKAASGFAESAGSFAPVGTAFGGTGQPTHLPPRPDDEWGDVAAQIRKRDVKRAKEKQRAESKTRGYRK